MSHRAQPSHIHLRKTLVLFRKEGQVKAGGGLQAIGKFKHFPTDNWLNLSKDLGLMERNVQVEIKDCGDQVLSYRGSTQMADFREQVVNCFVSDLKGCLALN